MKSTGSRSRIIAAPESENKLQKPSLDPSALALRNLLIIHPTNEDLEEYYFHRITRDQRCKIEDHLTDCNPCLARVDELARFILELSQAIQDAPGLKYAVQPCRRRLPKSARQHRFISKIG